MASSRKKRAAGPGALLILEEAVHLVRTAKLPTLAAYYLGAVPFVLGVLYFWADMAYSGDAQSRGVTGAVVVTLLFFWMKPWQTVFMRGLLVQLSGKPERWTFRRFMRMAISQAVFQSTGFITIPFALLAMLVPLPWINAYYQSLSVLDDGTEPGLRALSARAWKQAKLWPGPNFTLMWLLSPLLLFTAAGCFILFGAVIFNVVLPEVDPFMTDLFAGVYMFGCILALLTLAPLGIVLALNLIAIVQMVPALAKTLFGIPTIYTDAPGTLMNTVLIATICAIVYLLMDPFMKAVYVLRCFKGESLYSGEDIKASLRRVRNKTSKVAVVLFLLGAATLPGLAQAQESSITPDRLDEQIERVLTGREYTWRIPLEQVEEKEMGPLGNILASIQDRTKAVLDWLSEKLRKLLDWFRDLWPEPKLRANTSNVDWQRMLNISAWSLLVLLVGAVVLLILRTWWRSGREHVQAISQETPPEIDLEDEGINPDELPEEGWVALARELFAKGDTRLAMRALFLAGLAWLGRNGFIGIERYKSNRDYLRELNWRAHAEPQLVNAFEQSIALFESVWYGNRAASPSMVEAFEAEQKRMHTRAQQD